MRIFNPSIGATGATGLQGPGGGGGAGGLMFYLNQATTPDFPITGLPATAVGGTPVTIKELGRISDVTQSSITSQHLPTNAYNIVAAFVSDLFDPNITSIPPGLWDLNFWASSTANTNNQTIAKVKIYKYNGTAATLIASSDDLYIYDPSVIAQYTANIVIPAGTTLSSSDRIYIEILAKGSSNNYTITLKFGDGTPTHLHTTIPSVSGTGLMKVVDGLPQTPASLLTNADVAANANITLSKINLAALLSSMHMSLTEVDTYDRGSTSNTSQNLSTGNFVHMSLFTPLVDITANYISVISGPQPNNGNLKLGLYTYTLDGSNYIFTKVVESSGTHSFNGTVAGSVIKLSLTNPHTLSAGVRYAVAVAVSSVTGATNVTLAALPSGTITPILFLSPAVAATYTAQSSLLNTFTHTSANTPNYRIFARVSNA